MTDTKTSTSPPLYLSFDLSTQQLKALLVTSDLTIAHTTHVTFSTDLSHYKTSNGVLSNSDEGEVYAPVAMWLEALDLVLSKLVQDGVDLSKVRSISGSGQQHGSVYWSNKGEQLLSALGETRGGSLVELLCGQDKETAFSSPWSPNWQDSSTQKECDAFEAAAGGPEELGRITGSKAHHRFTGPQIMRLRQRTPEVYAATSRISLVSSFLASVFIGSFTSIDISDVCGMNLWDINKGQFSDNLLELAAGKGGGEDLRQKLGPVYEDGGKDFGPVSKYFVEKYGFSKTCTVSCFTGDNPSTILSLPLRPLDAIISLGTSTTFLMATPKYEPDPSYHLFNSPTTPGIYMFMLCYKNGGLAREQVRDDYGKPKDDDQKGSWTKFNQAVLDTPPLSRSTDKDDAKMGLFFPKPEIVPNVRAGTWRFAFGKDGLKEQKKEDLPGADARMIVESQMLSIRLRSQKVLVDDTGSGNSDKPPQPRRIYCVGGGSVNESIVKVIGDVLGGTEGVWRLDVSDACALGGAYKAVWACERKEGETFEDFIGKRWREEEAVKKIGEGYDDGVFKQYGDVLDGFAEMEELVLKGEKKAER